MNEKKSKQRKRRKDTLFKRGRVNKKLNGPYFEIRWTTNDSFESEKEFVIEIINSSRKKYTRHVNIFHIFFAWNNSHIRMMVQRSVNSSRSYHTHRPTSYCGYEPVTLLCSVVQDACTIYDDSLRITTEFARAQHKTHMVDSLNWTKWNIHVNSDSRSKSHVVDAILSQNETILWNATELYDMKKRSKISENKLYMAIEQWIYRVFIFRKLPFLWFYEMNE